MTRDTSLTGSGRHDPDRRPRRARLPGPGVIAGLAAEIPAVPGPPDVEPEPSAARALRDEGGRQVGGQVRSGHPLRARARRRWRLGRIPPGRVRWSRPADVLLLRGKRQQLDHGIGRGGRAAATRPSRSAGPGATGPGATGSAGKDAGGADLGGWGTGGAGRRGTGYRPVSASPWSPAISSGDRPGDRNRATTPMPPTTTETITAMMSEACTRVAAARPPISAAAITSRAQPNWTGPNWTGPDETAPAWAGRRLRRPWELTGPPGEAGG